MRLSPKQKTALHYAAKYDCIPAARLLLERGADPNRKTKFLRPEKVKSAWTALHYAVRADSASMVRLLLSNGADPALR
jgi:ankyrin repeat protein